ncbi:PREDICTED: geranylgeranyl pyrophosphate synthase-like [Vollenhovia emeryi]|uniref:geranylgeranyl pyrophosphate synthase-like n=1 Tax=Vollenhovia emeryi TaxID=411798 RepID=UPI0005F3AF48|nr:PREDICTED: geranylgeranyl pyrophosphate synthase-like [Vollenhovia emeryi]
MTGMSKVEQFSFVHSESGDTEEDKKLLEPFKLALTCGEKHLYVKLMPFFNHWLKISPDRFQQIKEIIDIIHHVYIIFDDIQDNGIVRDGFPVVHSIYGLSSTINCANYAQIICFMKLLNLHPDAMKIMLEELSQYDRGQGLDMYYKDNFICPTEEEYMVMIKKKAGWLPKVTFKLMKLFSTYEKDLLPLATAIGVFRQIHDDYCNVYVDKDSNDRSYCDDLTEGKFGFPIIHAITTNPNDKQILNIVKLRTTDVNMKRHCVKLLESFGSFKYTRGILEELEKKMKTDLERLGGNPILMEMMDDWKIQMSKTRV